MAAVRVLAFLLLVVFSIQLTTAGVTRRDTQAFNELSTNVTNFLNEAVSELQNMASRYNASDFSSHLDELTRQLLNAGTRITEAANNLVRQAPNSNSPAPAAR